jgi:lipopolysaccharide transport system permease protein
MHQKISSQTGQKPHRVLYTPESMMRHPLRLFRIMWRDLLASRELAWQLMKRDISAQYRQSFLGIAWAIIPSLISAIGFSFAADSKVLNIGITDLPYPAYVMFGTALWQTFVEAMNGPVMEMTTAKQMLSRINFPREALILSRIGQVFFNFAFKLILIVGMFISDLERNFVSGSSNSFSDTRGWNWYFSCTFRSNFSRFL